MSDLHRGPTSGSNLLDELEALKQLLNDSGTVFLDDAPSIPVLRDVVSPGSAPLLDLEEIFEEQLAPAADAAEPPDAPVPAAMEPAVATTAVESSAGWERDLLIQEVVDEFVPQIEAALRDRLRHIDAETLHAWLRGDPTDDDGAP